MGAGQVQRGQEHVRVDLQIVFDDQRGGQVAVDDALPGGPVTVKRRHFGWAQIKRIARCQKAGPISVRLGRAHALAIYCGQHMTA